jgi:hypothetical protein
LTHRDAPSRPAWLIPLFAIVLIGLWLRFSGLDWGLRHPVHTDEGAYVGNVVKMLEAGDLDHRFYTAPGLFFYLLAPAVAWLGPERWSGPDAYLVSRGVVAAFGVLNIVLIFFVGFRLVGPWAGLAAALSLAVSPVDVQMSHQVRQDGMLQTAGLLAILVLPRVGERRRDDAMMGLLIGLGTAIKFTGLLLVPAYLVARLLAPGRRWQGLVLAGLIAIGVTAACSPYSIVRAREYAAGPLELLRAYYPRPAAEIAFVPHLRLLMGAVVKTLGPVGSLLAAIGLVVCLRRAWRTWLPPVVHPVTTILVMATGAYVFERYVLPGMGIVHLMLGVPVEWLARRSRFAALALAACAAVAPTGRALEYVRTVSGPSAQDRALDWIEANVPAGARILETRPDATFGGRPGAMIGLSPERYELLFHPSSEDRWGLRLLAPHMDLVIKHPGLGGRWTEHLRIVYPARSWQGYHVFNLLAAPDALRPDYEPLPPARQRITASGNATALPRLHDGDLSTAWSSLKPRAGNEWIQLELEEPATIGKLELVVPTPAHRVDPELKVLTSEDGSTFRNVHAVKARAPLEAQPAVNRPASQILVLNPRPVRALRVHQLGIADAPWKIAELRVGARRWPDAGDR